MRLIECIKLWWYELQLAAMAGIVLSTMEKKERKKWLQYLKEDC